MKKKITHPLLFILLITFIIFILHQQATINTTTSMNSAAGWLVGQQNKDGSISLSDNSMFKIWDTANAVVVLSLLDKSYYNETINKSVRFLNIVKRSNGSFYMTTTAKEDYCIETTAVSLIALNLVDENISDTRNFLANKQNVKGYWEIGTPFIIVDKRFPSVTGYAVVALALTDGGSNTKHITFNITKALDFIASTQLEDGSWGSSPMYYDTPYYATYVDVWAAELYDRNEIIEKALGFVLRTQNSDGSWGSSAKGRPSKELRTALALNTLLVSDTCEKNEKCKKRIEKGVQWLIKKQRPDGSWNGGYFVGTEKKEDIYATTMAMLALIRYKNMYKNPMG
ncbi:MAG: hypothetical protein J7K31_02510 [Candidatus Aenigmarchaeota archaeon]|nr:hypothetical protein [Candidatus Aenigmarchaeota archaeon]